MKRIAQLHVGGATLLLLAVLVGWLVTQLPAEQVLAGALLLGAGVGIERNVEMVRRA